MLRQLCIIVSLIFIVLLTSFIKEKGTPTKRIALWSAYFDDHDWEYVLFGKKERLVNRNHRCIYHTDRTNPLQNDALVFHGRATHSPPMERTPNQIYLIHILESPYLTIPFGRINRGREFYNWTATYHRMSDIHVPYFAVNKLQIKASPEDLSKLPQMMYTRKSNEAMVLQVVSNCNSVSKRERYVKALKMTIKVDVVGKCGVPCERATKSGHCHNVVHQLASTGKYKFYLSFENAACEDYITEKVFNALDAGLVPIVYGGLIGKDYIDMLPPHSFIDVRNFRSPSDLANYLEYLDENDSEYKKYFEWKDEYELLDASRMTEKLVYELCDALHDSSMMKPRTVDFYSYWQSNKMCDDNFLDKVMN